MSATGPASTAADFRRSVSETAVAIAARVAAILPARRPAVAGVAAPAAEAGGDHPRTAGAGCCVRCSCQLVLCLVVVRRPGLTKELRQAGQREAG